MNQWEPKLFPEYLNDYCARRKRTTGHPPAVGTLRTKEGHLSHAYRAAGVTDETAMGEVLSSEDTAVPLIEKLLTEMSSGGARSVVYTLIDYAEWLRRKGLCESCALTAKDAPPQNPQGAIRTFSPAEVELLISAARGVSLRWFGFIATLAETGRRPGEVLNLEWSWARLNEEPPHFILPTTKTRRPQAMPLTERLVTEVYTPENIALLQAGKGGARRTFQRQPDRYVYPMTYTSVNAQWVRFTERLGLSHRGGLHKFRHSKATQLLSNGVPIHAVARLLGHASVTTTMKAYDGTSSLSFANYLESYSAK
jgi:integrase